MSVGLSITLSQDIQVPNFACSPIVETIDADITSGESRWSRTSAQTGEIYEKLLTHKIHCNNWGKIHFLPKLNSKILGRYGDARMWRK